MIIRLYVTAPFPFSFDDEDVQTKYRNEYRSVMMDEFPGSLVIVCLYQGNEIDVEVDISGAGDRKYSRERLAQSVMVTYVFAQLSSMMLSL